MRIHPATNRNAIRGTAWLRFSQGRYRLHQFLLKSNKAAELDHFGPCSHHQRSCIQRVAAKLIAECDADSFGNSAQFHGKQVENIVV